MENLHKLEQLTEEHIARQDIDAAVKGLYELVICYAKAKDFAKANALRERLMEVNNLALHEIVTAAEIIEAEKTASIDKKHREIWKDLYNLLSEEEANALYYSLEKIDLDPDQTILTQGKSNSKLFFLDAGNVKITFTQERTLEFVKEIYPGETFGHDTFFPISLCTTSATTSGGVQTKYLQRPAFDEITERFPGFDRKLETFCRAREGKSIESILQEKDFERRQQKRFAYSGRVQTQLIDNTGKPLSKPFAGFLDDISSGGLSFLIKCSQKSTARMLLGRPAFLTLEGTPKKAAANQQFSAQIVCAKHRLFNDYSVHVKFEKSLTPKEMAEMGVPDLN